MAGKQADECLDLCEPQEGVGDDADDADLETVDDFLDNVVGAGVSLVVLLGGDVEGVGGGYCERYSYCDCGDLL